MRSILVPADFSECSAAAYPYAAMLAERSGATIYLLHVLDIPFPTQSANGSETATRLDTHFMMELMKLTKVRMSKVRNGRVFKKAKVEEVIEVGYVADKVCSAVKKYKIDMIVMGTHGTSGLQEKFVGANAEKIVRNSTAPVLSVKQGAKISRLENIMLATDFSKEVEQVFPAVTRVADLLKARLVLAKVITPDRFETSDETSRQIENFRTGNKAFSNSIMVHYAASKDEGIRRAAEICGADIIALGTHGRHGLSHFFRGSIAEDVVSHAALPVLTLNVRQTAATVRQKVQEKKARQYDSDLLYQIPSI